MNNEKMSKMKKMKKQKMKKFGIIRKNLDDFHDLVSECEENQQPILRSHRFSEEKRQFSLDGQQKQTFYQRKSTKKFAKVSRSNNE